MSYRLYIGNRAYFSWSLTAGMLFDHFDLMDQVDITVFHLQGEHEVADALADIPPARTLPTLVTPDGAVLNDTLAMAEELATRHPDQGMWPTDPLARATARALANEMHSSFGTLRSDWAVNLHHAYQPQPEPEQVGRELDRLEQIWTHARQVTAPSGPWLCGAYSIVDAMFAPMAVRMAICGFDKRPVSAAYVAAHLSDPALLRWRALAVQERVVPGIEMDLPHAPWPGPAL